MDKEKKEKNEEIKIVPATVEAEENNFMQVRKQYVAQRTDLVQKSKGKLSRVETMALKYMISKVRPGDEPHKKYIFSFSEFSKLMRYKTDSYNDIKAMLQRIADVSWWNDKTKPNGDDALLRYLNIVRTNERKGMAIISFHEDLFPYILNLKEQYDSDGQHYFQYLLQNISLMKGSYSADLYELLRSYANNDKWTFEVGTGTNQDIQQKIAKVNYNTGKLEIPENWKNWAIFERDVLKPSKKEINTYTDIVIDYEPSKIDFSGRKYRRYVSVTFYIAPKSKTEQERTDTLIDNEYRRMEDYSRYRQMTIQEIFLNSREAAKEEDVIEAEFREVDKYRYPVFKSCMKPFKDKELDALFDAAVQHLEAGKIRAVDREMWATDYVSHYYSIIKATPDDTKTTPFKRLYDMVRKDYENFAAQIVEYDIERNEKIKEELAAENSMATDNSQEDMSAEEIEQKIMELQRMLRKKKSDKEG